MIAIERKKLGQVLEALENGMKFVWTDPEREAGFVAIDAINEALAQPEQERFHVATIGNWGRVEWVDGVFPSVGDKMYSAPPQEKNT